MTNSIVENMISKDQLLSYIYGLTIKTGQGLEKAVEMAQAQIPDIIQQYLVWKLAENVMNVLIPLILFGLMFPIKNRLWPKQFNDENPLPFMIVIGIVLGFFITGLISVCQLCSSGYRVIQIWLAPKVFLLEQVKNLFN